VEPDQAAVAAVVRRLQEAQRLVRFLAVERGRLPMADLADRVGVAPDTVERMLSGRTWPAADLVGLLAEELQRPLAFTRGGVDVRLYDRRAKDAADRERELKHREQQWGLDASAEAVLRRLTDDPALAHRVWDGLLAERREQQCRRTQGTG
jgi:transcriptional regulator with XRE-family HTH domain